MSDKPVQKGWVYEEDGVVVYRAYSIGNCIRSMTAARLGESAMGPNASLRAAMDESSGLEDEVIKMYENETGHTVIWRQHAVSLIVNSEDFLPTGAFERGETFFSETTPIGIRAHVDGLDQELDEITEVKTFGDNNWNAYLSGGLDALPSGLGRKYRWQAAVQGHASGRKVRFVIGHKVKDAEGKWYVPEIMHMPGVDAESLVPLSDIKAKIDTIERHANDDELPECDAGCREGDPYGEVHFFESVKKGDEELHYKLARYQELKTMLGSADKGTGLLGEFEDLKDDIKEMYGPGTHVVGVYTAKVVVSKPSERIDTKRLKTERPDVAAEFTTFGQPVVRLTVTGGEAG